jgi:hypothetical protein
MERVLVLKVREAERVLRMRALRSMVCLIELVVQMN